MAGLIGCLIAAFGCAIVGVDFLIKQNYSESACFIIFGAGYIALGIAFAGVHA